jgi:hypothetical protein
MKKIAFILVAFFAVAPAMADVEIYCTAGPGPNDVTISYDASSEANLVRAFALEISVNGDEVVICEVNCVSSDYYVYPGSISIDAGGTVTDWGSCACSGSYPGTPDEPNHKTIEMGSLYVGEANEPASSGDLVFITVSGCAGGTNPVVSIVENAIRGGVVMENPQEVVTVTINDGCEVPVPVCWCATCQLASECAGHSSGDGTCDGQINLADLFALKAAFGASAPWTDPECCSDYNNDQSVNLGDLFVLKAGFGSSGYVPSTGSQSCP